jgi:hypothetical protein
MLLLGLLSKPECETEEEELVLSPHLREVHPKTPTSLLPWRRQRGLDHIDLQERPCDL